MANISHKIMGKVSEAVPQTAGYQTRSNLDSAVRQLRDLASRYGLESELADAIEKVTVKRTGAAPKATAADGQNFKKLTTAAVRNAITKATGLAGWHTASPEDPAEDVARTVSELENQYEIAVDPKQVQMMWFTREANDRSELYWISVANTPAGVYLAHWSTDRADGGGSLYKSLEDFQAGLSGV